MGLCLKCNKWINQPEGKRIKLFCNSTCRSNYWYAQNKKGVLIREQKPPERQKEVIPDTVIEAPLSFDKLKQEMAVNGAYEGFIESLQNSETINDLENIGRQIERSSLSWPEKKRLHAFGQQIANQKFDF